MISSFYLSKFIQERAIRPISVIYTVFLTQIPVEGTLSYDFPISSFEILVFRFCDDFRTIRCTHSAHRVFIVVHCSHVPFDYPDD